MRRGDKRKEGREGERKEREAEGSGGFQFTFLSMSNENASCFDYKANFASVLQFNAVKIKQTSQSMETCALQMLVVVVVASHQC